MPADAGAVPSANWAGNVTFRARRYYAPTTIGQLQKLVAGSDRLRALGSGHSFNQIADTTGDLVSLAQLPKSVEIDTTGAQVRLSAAVRYGELTPRLHKAGLALHNLGSLPHISVAGACATGTHGSGITCGNLATQVAAIELIAASGEIVELRRDADSLRFAGSVIALGCLGVVTRLTLDLVPSYDVTQFVYEDLPDEQLDQHIEQILAGAYSVSVFTDLRINSLWRKYRSGEPEAGQPRFGARPADAMRHPVPGTPAHNCTEQLGVPGPWHERLPHFRPDFTPSTGAELQSEYLLARRHALDALAALRDIREQIRPVLQIAEIRTVAADDLWLSPSYLRDSVAFHFTWVPDEPAVAQALSAVEACLASYEPRPHWGKLFGIGPESLNTKYPRMADFGALMRDYDPAGKFGNDLTEHYLC